MDKERNYKYCTIGKILSHRPSKLYAKARCHYAIDFININTLNTNIKGDD